MGCFRSRVRGERGTAAVEFALLLPVLLLILFGVIEWGKVFSQVEVYNGMAREGARCAAVQQAQADANLPVCSIYTSITGAIPADGLYAPPASGSVSVTVTGGAGSPYPCSGRIGQEATVAWTQPLSVAIPFFGSLSMSHPIEATFRCE
jgi:Flp pilus assembly protein TadG